MGLYLKQNSEGGFTYERSHGCACKPQECQKVQGGGCAGRACEGNREAGLYAPSGMGYQKPVILAVTDKETRDELSDLNRKAGGWKEGFDPFYGAPVVISVLTPKDWDKGVEDGSLAIGQMLLAAHALGLGGCWIHRAKEVFETEEGKEILKKAGLEGEYLGIGNLVIGYADQQPKAAPRKAGRAFFIK